MWRAKKKIICWWVRSLLAIIWQRSTFHYRRLGLLIRNCKQAAAKNERSLFCFFWPGYSQKLSVVPRSKISKIAWFQGCLTSKLGIYWTGQAVWMLVKHNQLFVAGDFSWSTGAQDTPGVTPAIIMPTAAPVLSGALDEDEEGMEDMEEDIQATVARLSETFTALRTVLTPLFYRGFFAFLTWWVAACQVISSLFGIYFHQYLMQN